MKSAGLVGGKAENLTWLGDVPGIKVPEWRSVDTSEFEKFCASNLAMVSDLDNFMEIVGLFFQTKDCDARFSLKSEIIFLANKISQAISKGDFPPDQHISLGKIYAELTENTPAIKLAVRSSCVAEDSSDTSFAGICESYLNIKTCEQMLEAIRKVWLSAFTPKAVGEILSLAKLPVTVCPAVIIQRIVNAQTAGTAFSRVLDSGYDGLQIAANYGFGESVVGGGSDPDKWIIHRSFPIILQATLGKKQTCIVYDDNEGEKEIEVAEDRRSQFALRPDQVLEISAALRAIGKKREKDFGNADIDTEFAYDANGKLYFLQVRPLKKIAVEGVQLLDSSKIDEKMFIARGKHSIIGTACGRIKVINDWKELASGKKVIGKGDIVVAYVSTNVWTQFMKNCAGIITQEGGATSHPILLCRERKIPCVIGFSLDDFEKIRKLDGQVVTIDGLSKKVYLGTHETVAASPEALRVMFALPALPEHQSLEETVEILKKYKKILFSGDHAGRMVPWVFRPHYKMERLLQEIHLRSYERFESVLELAPGNILETKVIDNHVCTKLETWDWSLAHFSHFTAEHSKRFNDRMENAIGRYGTACESFELTPRKWSEYQDAFIDLRIYLWSSMFFREFLQRQTAVIAHRYDIPLTFIQKYEGQIQHFIPEEDVRMCEKKLELSKKIKQECGDVALTVEQLDENFPELFEELVTLGKEFRFSQDLSFSAPLDLPFILREIMNSSNEIGEPNKSAEFLAEEYLWGAEELRESIRQSVRNRILQSNAHHQQSRGQWSVRETLLNLGTALANGGILDKPESIFNCGLEGVAHYVQNFQKSGL